MQAQAAESSGYAGCSAAIFGRKLSNSVFNQLSRKSAVHRTRKRLMYSYLARNERVATGCSVSFAG
jgi:hypothetical protein